MKSFLTFFLCLVLLVPSSDGQQVLSLSKAINDGLENDFGVRIYRNNEQIAQNNNTAGNAGFLPSVGVDGNLNLQRNNTNQEFINGETSVRNGARSTRVDLGFGVNWTAFDGFRMFARRDRLELLETQAREETQAAMQALVADIQLGYIGLVRLKSLQGIVRHALMLHKDLEQQAQEKVRLGAGTRLAILQASQQVREDSTRLVQLQSAEEEAKIAFNRLIGNAPTTQFEIDSVYTFPDIVSKEEILNRIREGNFDLQLLAMDIRAANLEQKEVKSALYPTLDLSTGYAYIYQNSDAGFLLSNRTHGPYAGVTLTYDIFTGRSIRKDLQSADLLINNLELSRESLEQDILALAEGRFARYVSFKTLESLEQRSLETAVENTQLAREMYRLGKATDFELREAIFNEIQNRDRVVEARHQAQVQAIMLMELTGNSLGWIEE